MICFDIVFWFWPLWAKLPDTANQGNDNKEHCNHYKGPFA